MPLVGFKCPTERTQVPFDHFESCDKGNKGRAAFPPWLATMIARNTAEDLRHAGFEKTATRILTCPREVYITAMFDFYNDPNKEALRTRGTALHKVAAEMADPTFWYTEHNDAIRMTIEGVIGGRTISQKIDAVRRDMGEIVDYKFPMDWSIVHRNKPFAITKHIPQMNEARLLLGQQQWALDEGYDPDNVLLTIWDHGIGKNEGPKAVAIPHITEEQLLEFQPGGGDFTIEQIMEIYDWMEEQHNKEPDTPEHRERVAASLPLVGVGMFNGGKCSQYCDVEPICTKLVRKYGTVDVEFDAKEAG